MNGKKVTTEVIPVDVIFLRLQTNLAEIAYSLQVTTVLPETEYDPAPPDSSPRVVNLTKSGLFLPITVFPRHFPIRFSTCRRYYITGNGTLIYGLR